MLLNIHPLYLSFFHFKQTIHKPKTYLKKQILVVACNLQRIRPGSQTVCEPSVQLVMFKKQ
jgi:hypothetical protein